MEYRGIMNEVRTGKTGQKNHLWMSLFDAEVVSFYACCCRVRGVAVLALLGCCPGSCRVWTLQDNDLVGSLHVWGYGMYIEGWGVCDGVARLVVEWTKLVSPS